MSLPTPKELPEDDEFAEAVLNVTPLEEPNAPKVIRLHRCHEQWKPARPNCDCPYIEEAEADELVDRGDAEWYEYFRTFQAQRNLYIRHDHLVASLNYTQREDAREQEKRARRFEQHRLEREAEFARKLKFILNVAPHGLRPVARKYNLYGFAALSDNELCSAMEEKYGTLNGHVTWAQTKYFHPVMSRYWDALLSRENLSLALGDRPTGASERAITLGRDGINQLADDHGTTIPGNQAGLPALGTPAKSNRRLNLDEL